MIGAAFSGARSPVKRTDFPQTLNLGASTWYYQVNSTQTYTFSYTFPANTPVGFYYIVVWTDMLGTPDSNPLSNKSYRSRIILPLWVSDYYLYYERFGARPTLPAYTNSPQDYTLITSLQISNSTRNDSMASVTTSSLSNTTQYYSGDKTVLVIPGDTISVSVGLKYGFITGYLGWSHNAFAF